MTKKESLPEITKQAIFNCYRIIKEYLVDDDLWEENRYSKMYCDLFNNKLCIPEEIFEMIKEYVDTYISPIIDDPESVFDFSKIHSMDELTDDEQLNVVLEFIASTARIDEAFDKFALENLRPLIIG